jgi:hypothetical protein
MTKRRLSLALGLALSGTAAEAHHSIAGMYDGGRQVRVEGWSTSSACTGRTARTSSPCPRA